MKIWFQVLSNDVFQQKMRENVPDVGKHLPRCVISSEMAEFGVLVIQRCQRNGTAATCPAPTHPKGSG